MKFIFFNLGLLFFFSFVLLVFLFFIIRLGVFGLNLSLSSEIISKLENLNPNLRNRFIQSPLEDNLTNHIIDVLSNDLLLHFIILYLLIMLLIIISCKFIIKDNIEFTKIQNNPLGVWVKYLINKIISIWKVSSNFWIYFILFNVLVFNFGSIYAISNLLKLLK